MPYLSASPTAFVLEIVSLRAHNIGVQLSYPQSGAP
jgi:hypothetical protein